MERHSERPHAGDSVSLMILMAALVHAGTLRAQVKQEVAAWDLCTD